jgi:hypothetical protein
VLTIRTETLRDTRSVSAGGCMHTASERLVGVCREGQRMSNKTIGLKIQSARDTLGECLGEMKDALEELERLEDCGEDGPIGSGDVERSIAQVQIVLRRLDVWATKF